MAVVYLAQDLKHSRRVALKVLHAELAAALGPERFLREIQIAARLTHPHILPLHDSGQANEFLYYVMPYIEGESLRSKLNRERELPVDEVVRIVREVVDALADAHAHGIIHRDIKPDNVLLRGNHAVVTDFGVAKAVTQVTGRQALTMAGVALGTPAYMAPEQAAADPNTDHRADLYALGVMAYEMLTGRTPFTSTTAQGMLTAHLTEAPDLITKHRASVPPALEQLVMKCLEKRPADRWQSADGLLAALEAATRPPNEVKRGTPSAGDPKQAVVRRRVLLAAGVVIAVLAGLRFFRERRGNHNPAPIPRVVVLPFENLGTPEDEYFADGVTEEIASKLAGLSKLGVIARTSAIQYKKSTKGARQIGQELRVDYVLEGTVRWDKTAGSHGRVRVTPQLIRVADETQVWSQPFEGAFADVFRLQAEIAGRVATGMNLILPAGEGQTLAAVPTTNQEAYDDYLRGNALRAQGHTEKNLRGAIDLYQRAIGRDSGFAAAYRELSGAHTSLYRSFDQSSEELRLARDAADHALRLRPEEGHWALGVFYGAASEWQQALEHFKLAEALRPNESGIVDGLGTTYLRLGDWSRAREYLERAVALDPQSAALTGRLAFCYQQLFRYADAIQYATRAIALDPRPPRPYVGIIFNLLLWKGHTAEADSAVARTIRSLGAERFIAAELAPEPTPWLWANTFANHAEFRAALEGIRIAGSSIDSAAWYLSRSTLFTTVGEGAKARAYDDSARAVLERRVRRAPDNAALHSLLGVAYAGLGQREAAIRESRAAVDLTPDSLTNPDYRLDLGVVYAMLGERESAIETLAHVTDTLPSNFTRMYLRAIPLVAPLLNDPRLRVLPLPARE